MSLEIEETSGAAVDSRGGRKGVKWVGKGVGRALWRAVRASYWRRRRQHRHHHPQQQHGDTKADRGAPGIPFWSPAPMPIWDLSTDLVVSLPAPSWLPAPLQQLLWPGACPAADDGPSCSTAAAPAASAPAAPSRASRRRERRAARQQRRAQRRLQKQLHKASKVTADGSSSSTATSNQTPGPLAPAVSGGWATHVLAQMINPANTFPMLLHSAQHIKQQQDSSAQHPDGSTAAATAQQDGHWRSSSSSSTGGSSPGSGGSGPSSKRPQQLLTVGCRHWGNGMVQGLLRVKIYDFAIYLDGQQAQAHLPTTPLLLADGAGSSQAAHAAGQLQQQDAAAAAVLQEGQDAAQDLPAVLKSHHTPVEMSLVLKAARDVPLHLLSAEYEKVLRRRLDRVGGSPDDVAALQQLLASFSDASRLPPAVTAAGDKGSSGGGGGAREPGLPAAGAGGSVRKGAMIVFERSAGGDVTARVGPVVLETVSSPKVAEALFDLYLGDQPVSKTAKEAAGQTLQRIAASAGPGPASAAPAASQGSAGPGASTPHTQPGRMQQQQLLLLPAYYLPSSKGHEIKCEGRAGVGRRQQRKKRGSGSGGGDGSATPAVHALHVEDLDACVLHMG